MGCKKTLIWGFISDTRMQISIHSSPMLQVNCPILHASPLPLTSLNPRPWSHPLNLTHICTTWISKRRHQHIGTFLVLIQPAQGWGGGGCPQVAEIYYLKKFLFWYKFYGRVRVLVQKAFAVPKITGPFCFGLVNFDKTLFMYREVGGPLFWSVTPISR